MTLKYPIVEHVLYIFNDMHIGNVVYVTCGIHRPYHYMYIFSSNTINLNFMLFFWNYVGLMVVLVFIVVHSWGVHIVSKCFEDAITNNCSIFRRALFCRSCMKSQMESLGFDNVFIALVAVVNTKFPEVGHLLLIRIILHLGRDFKHNDKVGLSLSC